MIVAVLVWYDEDAAMLHRNASSWMELCDRLVALDGAWLGLPGGGEASAADQIEALADAGARTIYSCDGVWESQPAKRSMALRIAEMETTAEDWYFLPDADEHLADPGDAAEVLAGTDRLTATVTIEDPVHDWIQPRLMRALRGLRVADRHDHYVAPGQVLWDKPYQLQVTPEPTSAVLVHGRAERPAERLLRAAEYYRARGVE